MSSLTIIDDPYAHPLARFEEDFCFECKAPVGGHLRTDSVTFNDYATFTPYAETEIPGALLCEDCVNGAEECAP